MSEEKKLQNKHIVNIAKISDKIRFDNMADVKRVHQMAMQSDMKQTPIGRKFIARVEGILQGDREGKCLFCQKDVRDAVICDVCRERVIKHTVKTAPANKTNKEEERDIVDPTLAAVKDRVNKTVDTITEKMNVMAGGSGKVDLRLKDLFSAVFKKHKSHEAEEIFICGTKYTTPREENIVTEWPRPWLFSRIFLLLFASFYILLMCYSSFENTNVIPGIIFVGSCMIPLAILVFFFEVNAPRNISIFEVVKIFFLGGTASLFVTLLIFSFYNIESIGFFGAIMIGIIEEVGKLFIVAWFIRRMETKRYILNGMLIGAAVGAGFAVFESAGYAMRYYIAGLLWGGSAGAYDAMLDVIYGRAILSPGGHIAWAAFEGATLIIVMGKDVFRWSYLWSVRFLKFFAIPVAMHAAWDMPIFSIAIGMFQIKHILLIALIWIVLLVLLHRGLEEINDINNQALVREEQK